MGKGRNKGGKEVEKKGRQRLCLIKAKRKFNSNHENCWFASKTQLSILLFSCNFQCFYTIKRSVEISH